MEDWVIKARELKRDKGISWTKLTNELFKETGVIVPSHKIRDSVRAYERSNGLDNKKPDMSVVINISDVHVGKKTRSTDFEKICERMKYLFDDVLEQLRLLRKNYVVTETHINLIGDIIDNDSLYPSQPYHVDKGVAGHSTAQIKMATLLFSEAIANYQKDSGTTVVINAVKGNHGRISKFTDESNNFDIMFYNSLEFAMATNKKVKFNISTEFYNIVYINNHGFLLNHGNGVKMYQNIPWYGLTQRCMRWSGALPNQFDYMVVGHFHTCGEQEWNDKIIFMNGTSVTDDDFPVEFLGLSSSNNYWIFGVTNDTGITYRHKVNLGNI